MPHVAVRATFGYARLHRQDRLLAIKCLDLALLIDAEDKGSVGRGKAREKAIRVIEKLRGLRLSPEPHRRAGWKWRSRRRSLLRLPRGALAADSHHQPARAHPARDPAAHPRRGRVS